MPVRFGKLGKIRLEFSQGIITAGSYVVMQFDSALSRAPITATQEMLEVWTDVLELLIESKGKSATPLHEWPDAKVDVLPIFGGPTDIFEYMCADKDVASMPILDKLAEVLYDILRDVHFVSATVDVLKCKPRLVVVASECTAYPTAQYFNAKNMSAKSALESKKVEQEKIMRRIRKVLNAVWAYGGHAIVENPQASAFWKQKFCTDLETDIPNDRK